LERLFFFFFSSGTGLFPAEIVWWASRDQKFTYDCIHSCCFPSRNE